ncbi:hypothetical protein DFJ58DRAFT_92144 [Suillus subalutaceus]|uniref:uncharacterized protein n=1 Tax=Suillus subalutaceus TaxID=48586 RepID=UPI001B886EFD|nr:uncharacterized protein DFJ58DRAFT_92144 [Suillus subalutaceus]KAG1840358.1 hypothetical protein DFJ58DRAFT_92144 [Suillus subalutaceus]
MIVTCSTFTLYTSSFTKSANQAFAAAESGDSDQAMNKHLEFLKKFESNFNHWFKVMLFHSRGYHIPGCQLFCQVSF